MSTCDRIWYGVGVFFIICGIVIGFSWPFIYEFVAREKLKLAPTSETYKLWQKTPIPMYLDVYLFNWTNSQEFMKKKKTKPQFEEIGPFVFQEVHQRVAVQWHNNNNTVSYNQMRTWSFVPEDSVDLSTPIYNLNVVATTVSKMALKYNHILQWVLEFLNKFYKEKLLISRGANEWLFDGISDKLLNFIRLLVDVPYDKFGWFYGRNLSSTFDGRFNIKTGAQDIFSLGNLETWNLVNKTTFYERECGEVKGSTGELFAPVGNEFEDLTIFITDFCSSLKLKYSNPESVEGLNGLRYVGDSSVFDNKTECYCTGKCSPAGVRNVTSCRQAPLFVSFPHFYLADPIFAESVGGMNPNKSEHEFYLSIDQATGLPLEVRAQIQLNVLLEPLKQFPMFQDVPRVYIPMMWFRQRAKVTPALAARGMTLKVFGKSGLGFACGFAFLGLIVILGRFFCNKCRNKKTHPELLIPTSETNEEEPLIESSESER